ESTSTRAPQSPHVVHAQSTGRSTADRDVDGWDGTGAYKVEFGEVVQTRVVTIEGNRGFWGTATGAVAGGAIMAPTAPTTSQVLGATVGVVGGAAVGRSSQELLTRKEGQEIVVRLEEGRVVTVTQGVEAGRLIEGDTVKIVHHAQGAHISITHADERASLEAAQQRLR